MSGGTIVTAHKEDLALFQNHALQAILFAWIASFTSWFHHGVTFMLLFTTPSCICPHTRTEDKATVA